MAFESISDKPFSKQELLNRKLNLANAKLTTAMELSNLFAIFCIYSTVDLSIDEDSEVSPQLLIAFIINVSLLVVITVLVKIAIMYITPRLETALFMSQYDIKEFDQILHEDVILYMEIVWIVSSVGSTFLFSLNIILISWLRIRLFGKATADGVTTIMVPVLVFLIVFAAIYYKNIRKRNRKVLLNEDEISTGSSKVHYSKRIQVNNNNSHVANSRWDLIRSHVIKENNQKVHIV